MGSKPPESGRTAALSAIAIVRRGGVVPADLLLRMVTDPGELGFLRRRQRLGFRTDDPAAAIALLTAYVEGRLRC